MALGPVPWVAGGGPPCAVVNGPLTVPEVVTRKRASASWLTNQRLPSGPAVMPWRFEAAHGEPAGGPAGRDPVTWLAGAGSVVPPSVAQTLPSGPSATWAGAWAPT